MSTLGRNSICFCGSGKKYKRCCMNKLQGNKLKQGSVEQITLDEALELVLQHDKKLINKGVAILEELNSKKISQMKLE